MDAISPKPTGEAHLPPGHPPVRHGKIGVLLANLGSPSGTDYWSVRRYLKEFLSDRRVIETPRAAVVADPQRHHPLDPAAEIRPRLFAGLEQGAGRGAARHHHPRAGREAGGGDRQRAHHRRLGDALWRPLDPVADVGAQGAGLRAHPRRLALPAICGGDDRDRQRLGLRSARIDALAAGGPDASALPRRPGLYRRARRLARSRPRPARLRAGGGARLVPRPAARLSRQGRPLSLPVPEDDAAAARSSRLAEGPAPDHLPVALRPARSGSSPIPT